MGISATVVYDIQNHTTLVLRTPVSTSAHRHDVLDTIASFSQHCESVRDTATSISEVCALWGGPPYISYNVAARRFRVIVVWNSEPADVDLPHDVYHAIVRLQRAVVAVADALSIHETSALASIYDEAGYALRPAERVIVPSASQERPSGKGKLLPPLPTLSGRRSSAAEPRNKKKTSPTTPSLFGRLGAAIRNSVSTPSASQRAAAKDVYDMMEDSETAVDSESTSQRNATDEQDASAFGPDGLLDDAQGALKLPDDVFEWSPFSTSSSAASDNSQRNGKQRLQNDDHLDWFSALVRGQHSTPQTQPPTSSPPTSAQLPALRVTSPSASAPPTPLSVPSVVVVDPAEAIVTSSGGVRFSGSRQNGDGSDGVKNATQIGSVPATPSASTGGPATPLSPVVKPLSPKTDPPAASAAASTAAVLPAPQTGIVGGSEAVGVLQEEQAQRTEEVISSEAASTRPTMSVGSTMPPSSNGASNVPLVASNPAALQQAQQAQLQQQQQQVSNMHQQYQQVQQQQRLQQLVQQQGLSQEQSQGPVQQSQQQSQQRIASSPSHEADPNIPPALRDKRDDFDVSALGGFKDVATETLQLKDGPVSYDIKTSEDEVIRNRMNEFAVTMQSGNFPLALQQVYGTLRYLCQIQPRREREIVTCSNYVLAQKILMRNATLEGELAQVMNGSPDAVRRHVECALLTMFLAELRHLLPRHRVAAMRVAVEKNLAVGNYGMSARWLKQLLEKAPPAQRDEMAKQIQVCAANGDRNQHMPPTNRLCYATLQVVTVPYGKCDVCTAVYHSSHSGVVDGQACDTCFVGTIFVQRS